MIAVLDFGGQYAHLIVNRVRRLGVYAEIVDAGTSYRQFKKYKGIILSGGPQSVYEPNAPTCDARIFGLGIPVLGICYGHQLMVHLLGGTVQSGRTKEYGDAELTVVEPVGIFQGLKEKEKVWMSHGDEVFRLPKGMEAIGSTRDCPNAAVADFSRKLFGVQFHAEVTHTSCGMKILENFLKICRCKKNWNLKIYVRDILKSIQTQAKDKKVFMLVSGGVDSTVAFSLIQKALGPDRVYGLFVDTGFMRLNEGQEVMKALKSAGFKNLHVYDARKDFFKALKGIYDPEEKRRIIGDMFLTIQRRKVDELKLNPREWLLGQGTIYPDTIEAGGTRLAALIKTHHNRVPQIAELIKKGLLVEPLKDLYKDEVRAIGEQLGLGKNLVWRHPFPGPGLAVRCLCAKNPLYLPNYEDAEKKMDVVLKGFGMHCRILPVRSVGVQGDARTYRHPVAIMGESSWDTLADISTLLTNEFPQINRVLYTLFPDELKMFDVPNVYLTPRRIELLQKVDLCVMKTIDKAGLHFDIWQFPTVLLPLKVNKKKGESIVLRPVVSQEAMTANFYAMDFKILQELTARIVKIPGISAVFYDITNKPPGTIEWE